MRDAAGNSGELYTPRPVVRFMVAVTDPRLGGAVLDPACGTGGFLVEVYRHLEGRCRTVQEREWLRRPRPGRAAVVVPNGTLFAGGVAARIKAELLTEFNLHTIVRLPNGVFAPYTSIPTNILFFDGSGPAAISGTTSSRCRRGANSTQRRSRCSWWREREENERAWKAPAADILANGCNLDLKNPHAAQDLEHLPPEELVQNIIAKEARIAVIMKEITAMLAKGSPHDDEALT